MKKFVCMALALLLICGAVLPEKASAAETGSITVRVEHDGTKITGGELTAVKVGYPDAEDAVFRQVTNHAVIENIGKSTAVTQMQNFYSANKSSYTFGVYQAAVTDGVAKFEDIPEGLYLIWQETAASGYEKLSAFLVTVPYEGAMDVTAASKTALELEPEEETKPSSPSGNKKLPQTGQLEWPIPWLALAGMILFVLGWWLFFGKRKDSL